MHIHHHNKNWLILQMLSDRHPSYFKGSMQYLPPLNNRFLVQLLLKDLVLNDEIDLVYNALDEVNWKDNQSGKSCTDVFVQDSNESLVTQDCIDEISINGDQNEKSLNNSSKTTFKFFMKELE